MRIAWFRADGPRPAAALDSLAQLIDALRPRHTIDIIDATRAHDAVWQHVRGVFDVTVYELTARPESQFIWPYLLRYPGLTLLLSTQLATPRSRALRTRFRTADLQAERAFDRHGPWELLRAPLLASKLVAVPHDGLRLLMEAEYPDARIRPLVAPMASPSDPGHRAATELVTFGSIGPELSTREAIERAAGRARAAGARFHLLIDADPRTVLQRADVIIALRWPLCGDLLTDAMAAMAAARAPVVYESLETADWPALDPQNWVPRDRTGSSPPIGVTLDNRDVEHSLMLTLRRLSADAALTARLGDAAHAWWRDRFTLDRAQAQMERLLEEAVATAPPPRPEGWPAHLDADGTSMARGILEEFGLEVDLLA